MVCSPFPTFSFGSVNHDIKGTWKSQPGQVEHAVEFALRNGYTHIDTATAYDNEEVGQGIKASGVPRERIFLTNKLFNDSHKNAQKALDYSLRQLGTPYIDLCECLVDHPNSFTENKTNI